MITKRIVNAKQQVRMRQKLGKWDGRFGVGTREKKLD
jgi:hypothetical protein